jgi:oxygen-independent coproporphyrinogen-3 oxidase
VSLYIHIPFCTSKCKYCDFYSVSGVSQETQKLLVQVMLLQLDAFVAASPLSRLTTVYIGGGTPSLLDRDLLNWFLKQLQLRFSGWCLERERLEYSIESNPESVDELFLEICGQAGINRLSLGLQSFHQDLLDRLGRRVDTRHMFRALEIVDKFWPHRLSADLLCGIPGQSPTQLSDDIRRSDQAGHVSLYTLTPPPNTELEQQIDPEEQDRLWFHGYDLLEERGLINYEISNFARIGEECRHNLRYWRMQPYLGIGPGAVSTLPGRDGAVERLSCTETIEGYVQDWSKSIQRERISTGEFYYENLMMGLRLRRGIEHSRFRRRFGTTLSESQPELWARWSENGYVQDDDSHDALTDRGRMILNTLLGELLGEIRKLDADVFLQLHWV